MHLLDRLNDILLRIKKLEVVEHDYHVEIKGRDGWDNYSVLREIYSDSDVLYSQKTLIEAFEWMLENTNINKDIKV